MARDGQYPKEIADLSFFFTSFATSDEAAEYVIKHDQGPGTFLLRPSTRTNALTLTVSIEDNYARHVNVHHVKDDSSPTGTRFFIIIERSFSSFHDLYTYYTNHAITNLEQITDVRLLNPLRRLPQPGRLSERLSIPQQVSMVPMDVDIPPLPVKRPALPEPSMDDISLDRKQDRFSLDVEANNNNRTSSSSGGSVVGAAGPALGMSDLEGAVGGEGTSFAPGSPGASWEPRASVSSTSQPGIIVNFENFAPHSLVECPGGNFYLGPQEFSSPVTSSTPRSVPLPMSVVSKKEEKRLEKERQKLEKKRQKEEKQKQKEIEKMKKNQKKRSDMGWCRPPQPIPVQEVQSDDESPYYTTPRPYRNHLEELKTMLRESEICDCGLRMMDAELADGWTVHRSRESTTYLRVFYQHENGNTTWMFPQSITNMLTMRQVEFILKLCKEASIEEPTSLRIRVDTMQHPEGYYPQRLLPPSGMYHTQSKTSLSSNRSRSSSASSGQGADSFGSSSSFNKHASLDQRLPMPPPGEDPPCRVFSTDS